MTPERINTVIAEWCGWRLTGKLRGIQYGLQPGDTSDGNAHQRIPDYHSDLNAIHEVEKRLILTYHRVNVPVSAATNEANRYSKYLREICERDGDNHTIHATAPQRCEALLRTIGKWEESK